MPAADSFIHICDPHKCGVSFALCLPSLFCLFQSILSFDFSQVCHVHTSGIELGWNDRNGCSDPSPHE